VFAAIAAVHAALAVTNVVRTKRAVLVLRGTGAIERRQSIQEVLLKRPVESVQGETIELVVELQSVYSSRTDPRVTLSDGSRQLKAVPLYGTSVADFLATATVAAHERGVDIIEVAPAPVTEDN
jgi:hypothetical protein